MIFREDLESEIKGLKMNDNIKIIIGTNKTIQENIKFQN